MPADVNSPDHDPNLELALEALEGAGFLDEAEAVENLLACLHAAEERAEHAEKTLTEREKFWAQKMVAASEKRVDLDARLRAAAGATERSLVCVLSRARVRPRTLLRVRA